MMAVSKRRSRLPSVLVLFTLGALVLNVQGFDTRDWQFLQKNFKDMVSDS